jgi:hypothetical protein
MVPYIPSKFKQAYLNSLISQIIVIIIIIFWGELGQLGRAYMRTIHISLLAIACPRPVCFGMCTPRPPPPLVGLMDCKAQGEPYCRAKHYVHHEVGPILVLFRSERDLTFVSSCKIPILNSKKIVLINGILAQTHGIWVEFEWNYFEHQQLETWFLENLIFVC